MNAIIRTIQMLITGTPQKLLTGSIAWIILAVVFGLIGLMVPKIASFFNPCTLFLFCMAGLFLFVSLLKYAIAAFNRR
ncbi:hypothetical protein KSF_090650 [Reticulibacter mediterranei]|uniref:Uncharacterized protein n=1 Tax=Reticulibacter mediterranei TaxID=2778369 RepID=A0A8J3N980_9CHLR|nr:hypothetical protein [Reticulibacter mediterranei]GHO99017.1 hypothetical protein KSF_090650 [Reticulibacter mediterranei]